jgi:hypothetical protein
MCQCSGGLVLTDRPLRKSHHQRQETAGSRVAWCLDRRTAVGLELCGTEQARYLAKDPLMDSTDAR